MRISFISTVFSPGKVILIDILESNGANTKSWPAWIRGHSKRIPPVCKNASVQTSAVSRSYWSAPGLHAVAPPSTFKSFHGS